MESYISPSVCLFIALDAHMFSHKLLLLLMHKQICLFIALDAHMFAVYMGPGPGGPQLLGPWALVPGPYPLWLNICESRAINKPLYTPNQYAFTSSSTFFIDICRF